MTIVLKRVPGLCAVAAAAALVLVGCATAAPESTPTAASSAGSSAATAAPTTTPATDPADPATWVIDFGHVGPLAVGAALDGVAPLMTAFTETTQEACPWVTAYDAAGLPSVWLPDPSSTGSIEQVVLQAWGDPSAVGTDALRTDAGIGVGSTLDELRAAYPNLTEQAGKYAPFYAIDDGQGQWINFGANQSGVVDTIVLRGEAKIDSEYCG